MEVLGKSVNPESERAETYGDVSAILYNNSNYYHCEECRFIRVMVPFIEDLL